MTPVALALSFSATPSLAKESGSKKERAQKAIGRVVPRAEVPGGASEDGVTRFYGKVLGAVEIQGLKRIEKDAVLGKLSSKPGEKITRELIRADIHSVFAMGFFDDIDIKGEDAEDAKVKLTLVLKERPVISKVEFEGNERIGSSDLKDVIKVKEWSILDVNKVREDVALLQKHYEEKGFYLAHVNFEVKQVKPDEVELTYKINDYEKVQVKKITFLNNKRFSDDQLKNVFQETREGNALSFMTSSGNFKDSSFKTDLQRLTLWYLDHGYVKFRYENPVVTISDDKRWLYITVYVDEGDQYSMGTTDFSGDLLFSKEDLAGEIKLSKGELFSITRRNLDIQRLTEKYQDLGYAFVNVIPKMDIKDEGRIVNIEYGFEKGNLVHFGEINVVGNSKTYDKVIRRELKINEGELYSGTKLRESRENVERLGYFNPGEVIFNTITPKGKPDILNVEIGIKERSTGTITLGAGYGSVQKFFFTTQISEINLLGRGQTLSLQIQYAAQTAARSFNLGFTDPYTLDTKWTTGFDVFYVTFPIPEKYVMRKFGGDVRLGYPLAEYTTGYITYKNESLRTTDKADASIDTSLDEGVLSSVVWSVVRDKRNNRFEPSEGNFQSVSLETAGLGGDKRFLKWGLNARYYTHVWGDLVFRNSTEYGHIAQIGDRATPPSERFYLGGPNNMKGYQIFSLSPTQLTSTGFEEKIGGHVQVFSLFELEYPLIRDAGLKWVVFYDLGNAFEKFPSPTNLTVRTDAGFGIRWFSPIGPLRFEWGYPFNAKPTEESPVFQFFIGPPF